MLMRRLTLVLVCSLSGGSSAAAQVLVTGETGGSGAQAIVVSANLVVPRDFSTLANYWVEYGYGLADRVDVFATYGNISVFGDTQHYVGVGSNISILRRKEHGVDVSFFNSVSVPLNRRDQASTVLATLAGVVSRPLASLPITPYGGFGTLLPIGQRARGVFTPPDPRNTAIAGVAIALNKTWTAFGEYDLGPHLKAGGIAIVVTLPHK